MFKCCSVCKLLQKLWKNNMFVFSMWASYPQYFGWTNIINITFRPVALHFPAAPHLAIGCGSQTTGGPLKGPSMQMLGKGWCRMLGPEPRAVHKYICILQLWRESEGRVMNFLPRSMVRWWKIMTKSTWFQADEANPFPTAGDCNTQTPKSSWKAIWNQFWDDIHSNWKRCQLL